MEPTRQSVEELAEALSGYPATESDPTFRAEADRLVILGEAGGGFAHLLALAVILAPPSWLIVEEQSLVSCGLALGWLVVIGRSFLSIFLTTLETSLDLRRRTISVTNISPVLSWIRKAAPLQLSWEGEYDWSTLLRFSVRHRMHTKLLSGYCIYFSTFDAKQVPVAEFERESTAHGVAAALAQTVGVGGGGGRRDPG